jgi:hypothetical protein
MDKALRGITKWMTREEWRDRCGQVLAEHFGPACDDFDIDPEDIAEEIGPGAFTVAMACAMDDLLTWDFEPDGLNVVDDYIKRRGWKESVPAKRCLQAMKESVMSLYEVVDVVPGSHLVMKDLVRGGALVHVEDRQASDTAVRWDRIATRVFDLNGTNHLSPGILNFPPESTEEFLGVIRKSMKRGEREIIKVAEKSKVDKAAVSRVLRDALLGDFAPLFTRYWLHTVLEALRRPPPRVTNDDGEELVLGEVRFSISDANVAEIEQRLDTAPELERRDGKDRRWRWVGADDPPSEMTEAGAEGQKLVSGGSGDRRRLSLGSVELESARLVLSTNSRERAERGRDLLADLLGGLVGPPLTSLQSLESVMESEGYRDRPAAAEEIPPEAAVQAIHAYFDRHYRQCLGDKIPMLGDRTPRQAARSKSGRAKLVGWLKLLENSEARRARNEGQQPYDFGWMWEELGLSDRRK